MRSYISYYLEDRCHLGLAKDTPNARAISPRPSPTAKVVQYAEWVAFITAMNGGKLRKQFSLPCITEHVRSTTESLNRLNAKVMRSRGILAHVEPTFLICRRPRSSRSLPDQY